MDSSSGWQWSNTLSLTERVLGQPSGERKWGSNRPSEISSTETLAIPPSSTDLDHTSPKPDMGDAEGLA